MKTEFIAGRLHTPCRLQSSGERSRIVFLSISDLRRGERPRHDHPLAGVESEEPLNTVTLSLEFEEDILTHGKKGDQVSREVQHRVQGQTVGQLAGADAELAPGLAVNDRSHLAQQVLNIGENLERGVVGQVLLQKTVATVHRAVRD